MASVPVQAVLSDPGLRLAELHVDGLLQDMQVNKDLPATPWLVEFDWMGAQEGSHHLSVRAQDTGGDWLLSAPLTVTVVPSGTLAFSSNRDGPQTIYTITTDGRNLNRLGAGPGDMRQPAWGLSGSLAYVADPEVGPTMIREMVIGLAESRALAVGRDPAWSPDGSYLAYAATVDAVSQVFVVPVSNGEPVQVTSEAIYAGQPTWSPDGRELAYVAERDGNWDIWLVSADGEDPYRLTDDPAMDWSPAWSPDGSRLAFVSDRGGNHQIYLVRRDGSGVRALTDQPRGTEAPTWSPDGFWLAFVAYTGEGDGINAREIHLMRSDGRDQVRLTRNIFDDTQPDWRHLR
jgi:Tol biopolymer transport system component